MTFARGWAQRWKGGNNLEIKAYDIKTGDPSKTIRQKKQDDYRQCGVAGCDSLGDALTGANVIFSLVTADQALMVAQDAANHMTKDTLYLDGNSCAPETKRQAAVIISAVGGHYVDVAVMAPVQMDLIKVPLLLSGHHAKMAQDILQRLTMSTTIIAGDVGTSSTIKMMRSIMIKGMEALTMECILSARKAGVDDRVLSSLDTSFPEFKWTEKAAYMLERMATHGQRRAAEMQEVALTVSQLGLEGKMATATAEWQQKIGDLGFKPDPSDKMNYQILADKILQQLHEEKE